jgi:hypothetical protein
MEIRIFKRKKNITPSPLPLQVKWSFLSHERRKDREV